MLKVANPMMMPNFIPEQTLENNPFAASYEHIWTPPTKMQATEPLSTKVDNPFRVVGASEFVPSTEARAFTQIDRPSQLKTNDGKRLKRELCKYWQETPGSCKFGWNCHYAHGIEELQVYDRVAEEQAKSNDLYKTQNC